MRMVPKRGIVEHQHDDGQLILHGGGEFLAVHQEIAVAIDGEHFALGIKRLHRHRGGHAIAHEAAYRRHLGVEAAEAVEAVDPAGIIARAVAEDGIGRQMIAQPDHDLRQIDVARLGQRLAPTNPDNPDARR